MRHTMEYEGSVIQIKKKKQQALEAVFEGP